MSQKLIQFRFVAYKIKDGEPIRHLYVIGNGFDRYHGAASSYYDFRQYLLKHKPTIVKTFELFFGPRSLFNSFSNMSEYLWCLQEGIDVPAQKNSWATKCLWKDFEVNLSQLNRERVFDFVDSRLPRLYEEDEDFRYADYYAPIDYIYDVVLSCSTEMQYQFHRWVNNLHYSKGFKKKMVDLNKSAAFLNFNYTLFLESEYQIPQECILYIHGNRKQPFGSLVLGHNEEDDTIGFKKWVYQHRNRRRYRPNLKDKKGNYFPNDKLTYLAFFLKDETKGNWRNPIRYYAVNDIEERLEDYYSRNIKHCNDIIDKNIGFFDSLGDLERVTVLGHSLGDVDMTYFRKIKSSVAYPDKLQWEFSYHTDADITSINRFCRLLDIPLGENVRPYQLSEFVN